MQLFDTHAHLDDESLAKDIDGIVLRARQAGLQGICVVGCTPESSLACCDLGLRYPDILHASVGIQPNYVAEAADDWMDRIAELAHRDEVVAIGETGLDCYWKDSPLDVQRAYFDQHIELSQATGKPLIIHMRESGEEIYEQLVKWCGGTLQGVMHSFTGDWELAQRFLDLGLHISFAGMITFKNGANLRDVAARIPAERLLIETDSPYLSPEPLRGKRPNEPARVAHTAAVVATARGMSVEALGTLTTENALKFFGLSRSA